MFKFNAFIEGQTPVLHLKFLLKQVGLKRENEYIPIFEYILSFKDSSSYLEIGKSMQKIKL